MRNARLFGILFLIIGVVISWFYLSTLNEIGVTFRFLLAGPFIAGASIGMILLPGYTLTKEEWKIKQQRLKLVFSETKMINKVIWLALGIAGVFIVKAGYLDSCFIK